MAQIPSEAFGLASEGSVVGIDSGAGFGEWACAAFEIHLSHLFAGEHDTKLSHTTNRTETANEKGQSKSRGHF